MITTEISARVYRIEMTEKEHYQFMVIVAGTPELSLTSVSDAVNHILKHCADMSFMTVKEPETHGDPCTD